MEFGDRLKEARNSMGLTQEQLAEKIGVAKSTLAGYEKGNREPDVFKIKKLIEILGIDADYLLDINKEAPETETSESEADLQKRVQMLIDVFENCGYIPKGGDLTDDQLKFCMGLVDFLDTYFGG